MMQRCGHMPGAKKRDLVQYRDRGIRVCDDWRTYQTFEKWSLENGWSKGLQTDRIDNDGNYEPCNCRFVSRRKNIHNRGDILKVNGVPLVEIWEKFHVKGCATYDTFKARVVRHGWPICKALFYKNKIRKPQ